MSWRLTLHVNVDKPCGHNTELGKSMIDINKTYRTTEGALVTLFTTQAMGRLCVVGQIDGIDSMFRWNAKGVHETNQYSLVESPKPNYRYYPITKLGDADTSRGSPFIPHETGTYVRLNITHPYDTKVVTI